MNDNFKIGDLIRLRIHGRVLTFRTGKIGKYYKLPGNEILIVIGIMKLSYSTMEDMVMLDNSGKIILYSHDGAQLTFTLVSDASK